MKEFFDLSCKYEDMSPVIIPKGYTKSFIDGQITRKEQVDNINKAFQVKENNSNIFSQHIICIHSQHFMVFVWWL